MRGQKKGDALVGEAEPVAEMVNEGGVPLHRRWWMGAAGVKEECNGFKRRAASRLGAPKSARVHKSRKRRPQRIIAAGRETSKSRSDLQMNVTVHLILIKILPPQTFAGLRRSPDCLD